MDEIGIRQLTQLSKKSKKSTGFIDDVHLVSHFSAYCIALLRKRGAEVRSDTTTTSHRPLLATTEDVIQHPIKMLSTLYAGHDASSKPDNFSDCCPFG